MGEILTTKVKFDLEGQCLWTTRKIIGILTKVFCTFNDSRLTGDELARDWHTHGRKDAANNTIRRTKLALCEHHHPHPHPHPSPHPTNIAIPTNARIQTNTHFPTEIMFIQNIVYIHWQQFMSPPPPKPHPHVHPHPITTHPTHPSPNKHTSKRILPHIWMRIFRWCLGIR